MKFIKKSMNMKRFIAVMAVFCLLFTMAMPADMNVSAAVKTYKDVKGHRYEEALLYAIQKGLFSNSGSYIFPDNALTKGAACMSLNALLGATEKYDMSSVTNLKQGDKYFATVAVGLNAGYLVQQKNGKVYSPLAKATYGYVANIFSSILGVDMKEAIIGSHKASDTLTRGEYAAILQKVAPNIVTANTSKVSRGDVYVRTPDVTLSNLTVDGNLIITDAVADKEVTLRNVNVTGKLVVRGGGKDSIIITGKSSVGEVIVKQMNNKVSIKVKGVAQVSVVYVDDGCNDVIIAGSIETLEVAGSSVRVVAGNASIDNVVISGEDVALEVSEHASVDTVEVKESAKGAEVSVAGKVAEVAVAAKDVAVAVEGKGKVTEVKADKKAEGLSVEVAKSATVATVVSEADNTVVSGEGSVENTELTGKDSEVKTEVDAPTVVPTKAPTTAPIGGGGSGGGGGGTPSTPAPAVNVVGVSVSNANPKVGDTLTANVTYTGGTGTVTYQWFYSDNDDGTGTVANLGTSSTQAVPNQIGKFIFVTVTASGTTTGGSKTSPAVTAIRALTDAEAVAADLALIGTAAEIPFDSYADEDAKAAAATIVVQALVENGSTATVTWDSDHYELVVTKGLVTDDTVDNFTVTVATDPDIAFVAADLALIGTAAEIPFDSYADEDAKAAAATIVVQALVENGSTATVTWDSDHYELVVTKGLVTDDTVDNFTVTVATGP